MYPKKILSFGPHSITGRQQHGGAVRLTDSFCEALQTLGIDVERATLDGTSPFRRVSSFIDAMSCLARTDADLVVVHATMGLLRTAGTYILLVARLRGIRVVWHKFAGDLDLRLDSLPLRQQLQVINVLKHSAVTLVETHYLLEYLTERGVQAQWFPNVRDERVFRPHLSPSSISSLIYVGDISTEKGANTLVKLCEASSARGVAVTLAGPIGAFEQRARLLTLHNVKYLGTLTPSLIAESLQESAGLLFTSERLAEGHPGVVVEGLLCGIPVLAPRKSRGVTDLSQKMGPKDVFFFNTDDVGDDILPKDFLSACREASERPLRAQRAQVAFSALFAVTRALNNISSSNK